MINPKSPFVTKGDVRSQAILVSKAIPALRLEDNGDGVDATFGSFSQLRPGTTVEVCGEGFDERTVKVRANGMCYFVFFEDLTIYESSNELDVSRGPA